MGVPSTAYAPTRGAHLVIKQSGMTLDAITSPTQLSVQQTLISANALGLQPGEPEYQKMQLRNAGHFAILSIQMKFATNALLASFIKYRDMSHESTDAANLLAIKASLLSRIPSGDGHRKNLMPNTVKGVILWDRRVNDEGLLLLRQPSESWMAYRKRLQESFSVGAKVASFICLLLYPRDSELATIDTWMGEVLGFVKRRAADAPSGKRYDALQDKLNAHRLKMGMGDIPLGMYQWLIWDVCRGQGHNSHIQAALV